MKDVAGRVLTNYFGPDLEVPGLGRVTVTGGTSNTRIYKTQSGEKFTVETARPNRYAIEDSAERAGIMINHLFY